MIRAAMISEGGAHRWMNEAEKSDGSCHIDYYTNREMELLLM